MYLFGDGLAHVMNILVLRELSHFFEHMNVYGGQNMVQENFDPKQWKPQACQQSL